MGSATCGGLAMQPDVTLRGVPASKWRDKPFDAALSEGDRYMMHNNAQQPRPGHAPRRRAGNKASSTVQCSAPQAAPQATSKQPAAQQPAVQKAAAQQSTLQQSSAVLQYPEQPPQYQGIRSYVQNPTPRWQAPPIPTLDDAIAQLEAENAPEPEQHRPVAGIATSLKSLRKKLF